MTADRGIVRHTAGHVRVSAHSAWSERGVSLTFSFDPADPAAVTLIIEGTPWVFDRDLLDAALGTVNSREVHGIGDVRVQASIGRTNITFSLYSPDSRAEVTCPLLPVRAFMSEVDKAENAGYDVDGWLAQLLGDGEGAA